jgi:hypothetical protein
MDLLRRPYASGLVSGFGPADCLLGEGTVQLGRGVEHGRLLSWKEDGRDREFVLLPYPKSGTSISPAIHNFPKRPRSGSEPKDEDEEFAHRSLARMNSVIARIQELEAALDDTETLWERLSEAWDRAATIANPRMAEIVRQARDILPHLQVLERRMRRVLRRVRELTPLNRVQEMDRASMLWLVRQPGRTTEERAGADQRMLAIVREENFDTLENRVLHSYLVLAADVSREWLREHSASASSQRYGLVDKYRAFCRRLAAELQRLGVAMAEAGVTPNYVLTDDKAYREMREAWIRLLSQERILDDLWAWQAQSWTDFCTLAVTLSIHALPGAELVAQSPILWLQETRLGRWFQQENPLAVFWLRGTNRIVEVQSRPVGVSLLQARSRAHVWLRITDLAERDLPRRVAIWTPHCFAQADSREEAEAALQRLLQAQRLGGDTPCREGIVLMPAHGSATSAIAERSGCRVWGVGLDAVGDSLAVGMEHVGAFVAGNLLGRT